MNALFTQEELKRVLHYNAQTGAFTWLERTSNRVSVGDVAESVGSHGYLRVGVFGVRPSAHRLAWFYMTGIWPEHDIDHINGIRSDNSFSNLRCVTRSVNLQNRRTANCKSGLLGVYPHGSGFTSKICVSGKTQSLGTYRTPEEAHAAYVSAKRRLHEGCTI